MPRAEATIPASGWDNSTTLLLPLFILNTQLLVAALSIVSHFVGAGPAAAEVGAHRQAMVMNTYAAVSPLDDGGSLSTLAQEDDKGNTRAVVDGPAMASAASSRLPAPIAEEPSARKPSAT